MASYLACSRSPPFPVDAEPSHRERGPQLAPGVVQCLVQRAAGGAQPLGHDIDGHPAEGEGDENLTLARGELQLDFFPQRSEQVACLGMLVRAGRAVSDGWPRRRGDGNFSPPPGLPADFDASLDDGELAGPGRETALPAEIAKPAQDRHQCIVRTLQRKVIEVSTPELGKRWPAAADLEARRPQQHGMQLGKRGLALGTGMAEPLHQIEGPIPGRAGDVGRGTRSRRFRRHPSKPSAVGPQEQGRHPKPVGFARPNQILVAQPYAQGEAWLVKPHNPQGVLITGVFGSGKSSVAAEITYLLEQQDELYALLDLDYLGWVGDHATGQAMMLRNLAAVAANYRELGVTTYVAAYFVRDHKALQGIKESLGVPLRVVRLSLPLKDIEQRLAADVTSGRRDDLRDAAASIAASEGVGVEDLVLSNDRPVSEIAHEVMTWLGWL